MGTAMILPLRLLALGLSFLVVSTPLGAAEPAAPFETKATSLYLIEAETGTVLLEKNAAAPVSPASLLKILTAETVFDSIARSETSLSQGYKVSEFAWRTGGAPSGTATMFAALNSTVPVSDLLKGVMVLTANDSCLILAEGIAGSEPAFVEKMRERAKALKLDSIRIANATGLPDPGNKASMHDLALLARHVQSTYPDLYKLYALPEFEWNKILQRNRNPLLKAGIGVDGLATGFTEGEGYAIVTSAERDGVRLFLAMAGLASDKERVEEATRVLNWALSSFERRLLFKPGETIGEASVYGGAVSHVAVSAKVPVDVFVPVNNPERLTANYVYRWPLKAPVKAGENVGTVRIFAGKKLLREEALYTDSAVEEGSLSGKALDAALELVLFWW